MDGNLIECNPLKGFGQPTLRGRRLTVFDIVTKIYYEPDISVALEDYGIAKKEALAAIIYCKNLHCQKDTSLIHYCDGCLLRTLETEWNFRAEDYLQLLSSDGSKFVISKDGKEIFFGSLEELQNGDFGKVTWLIAEEILTNGFSN